MDGISAQTQPVCGYSTGAGDVLLLTYGKSTTGTSNANLALGDAYNRTLKSYKDLADLKDGEVPPGFRDFTADQIPFGFRYSKTNNNIIPRSMHSSSHSAKSGRKYVEIVDGKLVEIRDAELASTVVESDDEEAKEDTAVTGKKREREEESPEDDTQDHKPYKYKCGRTPVGCCYAQCDCLVCMGYLDEE